jgi:hypothetical protein
MASNSDFPSAGKRVLAALVSYVYGRAGVDSTLKQLRGREVAQEWDILADGLIKELMLSLEDDKEDTQKKKTRDLDIAEVALKKPPSIQ